MYLYNEDHKRIKLITDSSPVLGSGAYGSVYQISDQTCLKVYKYPGSVDKDILKCMRCLNLANYYKIHDFFYNQKSNLKAYTMNYYPSEELDILTTSTYYTLNNLFNILYSVDILNKNNILIYDTHIDNIIINKSGMTVIDTDLYTFNKTCSPLMLELKNTEKIKYLFESIYFSCLRKYHPELDNETAKNIIRGIFKLYGNFSREETQCRLEKYKYPIDYIRKKVR